MRAFGIIGIGLVAAVTAACAAAEDAGLDDEGAAGGFAGAFSFGAGGSGQPQGGFPSAGGRIGAGGFTGSGGFASAGGNPLGGGGGFGAGGAGTAGAGGAGAAGAAGAGGAGGGAGAGGAGAGGRVYPTPERCPDAREKTCDGPCVRPSPANGCSLATCVDCPSVQNGYHSCDGTRCSFECNVGFQIEGRGCTPADPRDAGAPPYGGVTDASTPDASTDARRPDGEPCGTQADCLSNSCRSGACIPARCDDLAQNGRETDVDCGGNCGPCETGDVCIADADCQDGPCVSGRCTCTPLLCDSPDLAGRCGSLDDGCGTPVTCGCGTGEECFQGSCCDPRDACQTACGAVSACGVPVDCGLTACAQGDRCIASACCTPTNTCPSGVCGTIDDGCGGTFDCGLSACGSGDVCRASACCTPLTVCPARACGSIDDGCGTQLPCGDCQAPYTCGFVTPSQCGWSCEDGRRANPETDVDCGGPDCAKCGDDELCSVNADCASGICASESCGFFCSELRCQAPTCTDGVKNGTETDLDCGGSCGTKCGASRTCAGNTDCASGTCTAGRCTAPTHCTSGTRNGDETDVDCGGACLSCASGALCRTDRDCQSADCASESCGFLCNELRCQ